MFTYILYNIVACELLFAGVAMAYLLGAEGIWFGILAGVFGGCLVAPLRIALHEHERANGV